MKDNLLFRRKNKLHKTRYTILPSALPNLKYILRQKGYLIERHPKLKEIFKELPLLSYRRG